MHQKLITCLAITSITFIAQPLLADAPSQEPRVEIKDVRGLGFYYNISSWLGDQLALHYRKKILSEAVNFEWMPVLKIFEKSAPKMYFDKNKLTRSNSNSVEFWGLEESSNEITDDGGFLSKPSVAYRYHFECDQPTQSKLLYAVKFSGPTGTGKIILIDTHFNGQWRRGGSDQIDQSLANFKPFLTQACESK